MLAFKPALTVATTVWSLAASADAPTGMRPVGRSGGTSIVSMGAHKDTTAVPRFEPGACPFTIREGERVDCGTLVVWENRAHARGPLVRIPVRIFRTRATTPAPDPILFMVGGPGSSAGISSLQGVPYLDQRDFIVFQQRGTQSTHPALECAEVTLVKQRIRRGVLPGDSGDRAWVSAAVTCANRLRGEGVDLGSYTTHAITEDIADLRRVLRIGEWNLYGLSYGTRVMLTVMRDYPEGVRSVVLDSPLPLESRFDEVAAANSARALDMVLDACAVTPQCAAAHPDLRRKLNDALQRFDREPTWLKVSIDSAHLDSVWVTGAALAYAFADLMNDPRTAGALPTLIDHAAGGDLVPLRSSFASNIAPTHFSMGMRMAVWCADVVPFEDRKRIIAQQDPALGLGGANFSVLPPTACDAVGIRPSAAVEGQAVRSQVPTLVLVGELDPNTPPAWGRALLGNLERAYLVEMPGQSHGPGNGRCGSLLIARFLVDPTTPPTDECVARSRGIVFSP